MDRRGGILLHPTSLPGRFGIGDLGPDAHAWIDFLAATGSTLWQILPLGPTGYGDSPYQTFSAAAGNPYLISPDFLAEDGLIDQPADPGFPADRVDYGQVIPWKQELLASAYERFISHDHPLRSEFDAFKHHNAGWLDEYATFLALKQAHGLVSWVEWPVEYRDRHPEALAEAREDLRDARDRIAFEQFLFFRQWERLRQAAHSAGIAIVGDIPIFVAHDSADVWTNRELFYIGADGNPTVVAGVPPDYFSETGQLWGNPLYRWSAHRATGYAWWVD
ncbi:MAG: 4-alpha-glucanotransferase, partial [Acidimicrobiia bacterium]|nr:4-alpha-glucanotransferase [Acidimicrobiia bacterium]